MLLDLRDGYIKYELQVLQLRPFVCTSYTLFPIPANHEDDPEMQSSRTPIGDEFITHPIPLTGGSNGI